MKFRLGMKDAGVRRYIEAKKSIIPKAMRMFGVEFYRQVTISTPVDTGRARLGWNCSIDAPDFTVPPGAPPNWIGRSGGGSEYYSLDVFKADKTFSIENIGGGTGKTIYISNAVPYIGALNDGHSRQAPARFVELAFKNAVDKVEKYLKS